MPRGMLLCKGQEPDFILYIKYNNTTGGVWKGLSLQNNNLNWIASQVFRTSDLIGHLWSQLFCFRAKFHC